MEDTRPEISMVIPVLNEAGSIPELYERLTAHLKARGTAYEVIFVDDGSTDGTHEILENLAARDTAVGYVRHFRNHGKSLALMHGFDYARGRVAVTMDGDLQDEPENIGSLVDKVTAEGYHLASGQRISRRDKVSKKAVSWVFNGLVSLIFGARFHDVNSGMKAYSRTLYTRLELRGDLHRLTPVMATVNGFRACEVPVSHSERKAGKSKYMLLRYRGLLDIFSLTALQSTQLRPFHIFGGLGFLSLIFAVVLFGIYFLGFRGGPVGRADLFLLLLGNTMLVLGALLVLMGLMAEMLMAPVQGRDWRNKMIRELRLPRGRENNPGAPDHAQ